MKGLCHNCLRTDVEIIDHKGKQMCMDCYHRLFKPSQENKEIYDKATFEDLKYKWEYR